MKTHARVVVTGGGVVGVSVRVPSLEPQSRVGAAVSAIIHYRAACT